MAAHVRLVPDQLKAFVLCHTMAAFSTYLLLSALLPFGPPNLLLQSTTSLNTALILRPSSAIRTNSATHQLRLPWRLPPRSLFDLETSESATLNAQQQPPGLSPVNLDHLSQCAWASQVAVGAALMLLGVVSMWHRRQTTTMDGLPHGSTVVASPNLLSQCFPTFRLPR